MDGFWQFPPSLVAVVHWGGRSSDLAGSLRAAGDMYDGRVRIQHTLLEGMLPLIALFVVAFGAGLVVIGLLLPLVSLIQNLT
jgi:type II secretory pathway component PulF